MQGFDPEYPYTVPVTASSEVVFTLRDAVARPGLTTPINSGGIELDYALFDRFRLQNGRNNPFVVCGQCGNAAEARTVADAIRAITWHECTE